MSALLPLCRALWCLMEVRADRNRPLTRAGVEALQLMSDILL